MCEKRMESRVDFLDVERESTTRQLGGYLRQIVA